MPFGLLIVVFLFGLALFGISGTSSISSQGSATATVTSTGFAPAPLTQADTGADVDLARGNTDQKLRLSHRWHWNAPAVEGGAVRLVPVNYVRDPGFDEWTIEAVAKGTSTITATGRPGAKTFRLTVRVS